MTLSALKASGLGAIPEDPGASCQNTSSAATAIVPFRSARTSAGSSTMRPRAVLATYAVNFIGANSRPSIFWYVRGVRSSLRSHAAGSDGGSGHLDPPP